MVMVSLFKENVQSSKISKVRRYNPKPLEAKIINTQVQWLVQHKKDGKKSAKEAGYHNMMNPWVKRRIPSTTPSPQKRPPQKCPPRRRTLAQAPCRTEGAAGDEIGRLKKGGLTKGQGHLIRLASLTHDVPRIFMSVGSHVSSVIILRSLWLHVATVSTKV